MMGDYMVGAMMQMEELALSIPTTIIINANAAVVGDRYKLLPPLLQ